MKVEFTPLSASLIPACRAFNERLRSHGEPPFVLPENAPETERAPSAGINWKHYLAVDEGGAVRGGVLLMEQRGWLRGQTIQLINIQSPLSEGLFDRTYSGVGLKLLKFVTRRSPYCYAVGMGDEQNSFPRLLKAAGWSVNPVPFQFAVMRASRFLRGIGPLRRGSKRWLAQAAAATGLGAAGMAVWGLAHQQPSMRGYALEPASSWPHGLDALWERCREDVSFCTLRDELALVDLYPDSQPRLKRFVLRWDGQIAGWSVGLVTQMRNNANFGDLVVGTILDGFAEKTYLSALLAMTRNALRDLGADLIITNQMHGNWREAMRRLGFFGGPSNYLLALSKPLATALQTDAGGLECMHVNRGDGDGRIHL